MATNKIALSFVHLDFDIQLNLRDLFPTLNFDCQFLSLQSFNFSIFCLFTSGAPFQSTLRLYGRVQQKFQLRRVVLINLSYEEYFLSLYFQGLKIIKNVFQFLACPVFGTVNIIIKSLIVNLLIA